MKITIIPKGCFPKLKGAICNISVETNNIVNVLQRGSESNDLIFVKLKRKLSSRRHGHLRGCLTRSSAISISVFKTKQPILS